MTRQNKPPLHILLRSYPMHARIEALIKCSVYEAEEGDLIVAMMDAISRTARRLRAQHKANAGVALHEIAIRLRRKSIRIVRRAPPHRVTRTVEEIQRSA